MIPDAHIMKDRDSPWRTAGILSHTDARQFVGRLSVMGIEHLTSVDGRFVRVSVGANDLQQAMELRTDTQPSAFPERKESRYYRQCLRLLVSLPLGAFLTTAACYWAELESRAAPSIGALTLAIFVELFAEGRKARTPIENNGRRQRQ